MSVLHQYTVFTSTAYKPEPGHPGMGFNLQIDVKADAGDRTFDDFKESVTQAGKLIDHRFLNEDIAYFRDVWPTAETIAHYVYIQLQSKGFKNLKLRLYEGPDLCVEVHSDKQLVVGGRVVVNCVHRHWNPDLNAEENKSLYGKCSGFHGHEYQVEAFLTGEFHPSRGYLVGRAELLSLLKNEIHDPFHGRFLNDLVGNTSGEKIAVEFFARLQKASLTRSLYRVAVRETRKNSFFIGADPF